jgi:hypothetical protein
MSLPENLHSPAASFFTPKKQYVSLSSSSATKQTKAIPRKRTPTFPLNRRSKRLKNMASFSVSKMQHRHAKLHGCAINCVVDVGEL